MVRRVRLPDSVKANGPTAEGNGKKPRGRPADEAWVALKKAWRSAGKRVPEMSDDLRCYAAVQADRARLAVSQVGTRVVSGMLRVIALAVVLATGTWLVIVGIAGGVASALGGNVWLANLVTGMAALVLLLAAIVISGRVRRSQRLRRLTRRYARHEARQRSMPQSGVPRARDHAERS